MSKSTKNSRIKAGFRILEMPFLFEYLVRAVRSIWLWMWRTMMAEMAPSDDKGSFQRQASRFRDKVEANPGARFPAESGRYVLFIGEACPWCHRVMLARAIKGLEEAIPVIYLQPSSSGLWMMKEPFENMNSLREVYRHYEPHYRGRFTAPLLLDRQGEKIVCNESSELIEIFNEAFNAFSKRDDLNLRPDSKLADIERLAEDIYTDINNGVYVCGFARNQEAYEQAAKRLFARLDHLEQMLGSGGPYLLGDCLTELDLRLFPTVFRLDAVYAPLFRCGLKSIEHDYPRLRLWMRLFYKLPGIAQCSDLEAIRQSYFRSLFPLNPSGIVPLQKILDLSQQ